MVNLLAHVLFGGEGEHQIEESAELHRAVDWLMEMFAEPTHEPRNPHTDFRYEAPTSFTAGCPAPTTADATPVGPVPSKRGTSRTPEGKT